jgi:hypothetical protein
MRLRKHEKNQLPSPPPTTGFVEGGQKKVGVGGGVEGEN